MSLSAKLLSELAGRVGQTNQSFSVADGQRIVRFSFDQCEQLAVTVAELRLETPELAAATVPQLEKASRGLAARINYLLEPVAPIETDAQGCSVQMRSNPPRHDDNGRRYFELYLRRGGSIAVCRYEKPDRGPRVRVPAVLTHEVIGRLVDDFVVAVDSM